MPKLKSWIRPEKLVAIFTLFLAIFVVLKRAYEIFQDGGHNWGIGEWLINYNGGFVRRGLAGQFLFTFTNNGKVALAILIFFQFAIVAYVSFFVLHHFLRDKFSWWELAVALNPAGLLAIAWDSNLLVRKEWLGLAILVWLSRNDMTTSTTSKFRILLLMFIA
jgi:hypothetical protein